MPKDTASQLTAAAKLHRYVARLESERTAVDAQLSDARRRAAEPPPPAFDEDAARAELAQAAARDIATGSRSESEAVLRHAGQRGAAREAAEAHAQRVAAAQAHHERLQAQAAELDARLAEARQLRDDEIRAAARGKVAAAEQRMRDATAALLAAMTDVMAAHMLAAEGDARRQLQFAGYFASLPHLGVYGKDGRPEPGDGIPPVTRAWGDVRVVPVESSPVVRARYRQLKAELVGEA